MRCEACKGNGHVYTRIAGDVHIATCSECDGWGRVSIQPTKPKYEHFGRIDVDELLEETPIRKQA